MRRAFAQVAWGLGIALIDITINGFDLLPDVVGYGLLTAGLSKLGPRNRRYRLARNAASVQLVLSVLSLLGWTPAGISLTGGIEPSIDVLGLAAASLAVELAMIYGLCEGIRSDALARSKRQLAQSARNRWHFAFAAGAAMLFLLPFQLNKPLQEMVPVVLILAVCAVAAGLLVLALARQAGREIAGNPGGGGDGTGGVAGSMIDTRV